MGFFGFQFLGFLSLFLERWRRIRFVEGVLKGGGEVGLCNFLRCNEPDRQNPKQAHYAGGDQNDAQVTHGNERVKAKVGILVP